MYMKLKIYNDSDYADGTNYHPAGGRFPLTPPATVIFNTDHIVSVERNPDQYANSSSGRPCVGQCDYRIRIGTGISDFLYVMADEAARVFAAIGMSL